MPLITIKDLPQSDELDRQAMLTIVGGTRTGARPAMAQRASPQARVVDYPPGFGRNRPLPASGSRSKA